MSYYPSVIARPNTAGFAGRRVHSAAPPRHIAALLTRLYRGPFNRDLNAMQRFLVNEHPGGWFQLGEDPTVDTGWKNGPQAGRDGFDVSASDWGDSEDPDDDTPPTWRHLGHVGWDDSTIRLKTTPGNVPDAA